MRRGTQGHVAAPRGPTRAHVVRCDMIFLFMVSIRVIVHIRIPYSEFTVTFIIIMSYIPDFPFLFFLCETKIHIVF